jgi:hypothetical protein
MEEVAKSNRGGGSEVNFDATRLGVRPITAEAALVLYGGSYNPTPRALWLEKFSLDSNSSLPND